MIALDASLLPEGRLPLPDAALLARQHLILYLDYAATLELFEQVGMLDRELALYRRLRPHLRKLTIVTWSRGGDERFRAMLGADGIDLVYNTRGWSWPVWMAYLFAVFPWKFPGPRIVKTNQMSGAQHILKLARRSGSPFIARCGYPWSIFNAREYGPDAPQTRQVRAIERQVFRGAAHVIGSTPEIARLAIDDYDVPEARCSVVPNYVDTELMNWQAPPPIDSRRPLLLFLGRLEGQKNPVALVDAVAGLDVTLTMIGDGSLKEQVTARAAALGVKLELPGNVPHAQLPDWFHHADLFVQPSLFEGHPKALLEAMSCGAPVIGADAPGIREVLRHEETGLLCGTDAAAVGEAIRRLLADRDLAGRLSKAARQEIERTVSLDITMERELRILSAVAKR